MDLSRLWPDAAFVVFDTETTGKYPLDAEICEIAAVKWQGGKETGRFQTLIRPTRKMTDEVIRIHNITNEMVADAPPIEEKIGEFHQFLGEAVAVAHHAPFDLGFMAIEFENQGLGLPSTPVLCTSLLSQVVIPESPNHRLQTLVNFLGIKSGQAHRALDDAIACLALLFKCLDRLGKNKTVDEVLKTQGLQLIWRNFSLQNLRSHRVMEEIISALREQRPVEIVYCGGSRPGQPRTVMPMGLVRNPKGDFLVACEEKEGIDNSLEETPKRYFLEKITKARS